jgi:hypothetical protein
MLYAIEVQLVKRNEYMELQIHCGVNGYHVKTHVWGRRINERTTWLTLRKPLFAEEVFMAGGRGGPLKTLPAAAKLDPTGFRRVHLLEVQ